MNTQPLPTIAPKPIVRREIVRSEHLNTQRRMAIVTRIRWVARHVAAMRKQGG